MPDEVRGDPVELARAAKDALTESQTLFTDLADLRDGMAVAVPTFLQDGSYNAVSTWDNTYIVQLASTAIERLVTVLEEEADGLYHTAFALQAADEAAAEQLGPIGPGPALP